MLEAGFGKVCISPPIGAPLAGFAAREGVSSGIHDDLFARSLVLSDEKLAFALVSVDLLALPIEFVKRVRLGIQRKTGSNDYRSKSRPEWNALTGCAKD